MTDAQDFVTRNEENAFETVYGLSRLDSLSFYQTSKNVWLAAREYFMRDITEPNQKDAGVTTAPSRSDSELRSIAVNLYPGSYKQAYAFIAGADSEDDQELRIQALQAGRGSMALTYQIHTFLQGE